MTVKERFEEMERENEENQVVCIDEYTGNEYYAWYDMTTEMQTEQADNGYYRFEIR